MIVYQIDNNKMRVTLFEAELIQFESNTPDEIRTIRLKAGDKDYDKKKLDELRENGYTYGHLTRELIDHIDIFTHLWEQKDEG